MEDGITPIYRLLEELSDSELNRFKRYLGTELWESYNSIPWGRLKKVDVTDTVELMKQYNGTDNLRYITLLILDRLPRKDLSDRLQKPKSAAGTALAEDSLRTSSLEAGASGNQERRVIALHEDSEEEEEYQMTALPRGFCIIINNQTFSKFHDPSWSELDDDNLKEVFTWLGFEVCIFKDLAAQVMRDTLQTYRTRRHGDCFVCFVLNHGEDGTLLGSDSAEVTTKDLLSIFSTENCPDLAGKPKVFFFQGYQIGEDKGASPPSSDFLCCMATIAGHVTWRNSGTGSFFIQSLCRQLKTHCRRGEDVVKILTRVKRDVTERTLCLPPPQFSGKPRPQVPEHRDTLTKTLIFPVPEPRI